jgi:hypothetical protein
MCHARYTCCVSVTTGLGYLSVCKSNGSVTVSTKPLAYFDGCKTSGSSATFSYLFGCYVSLNAGQINLLTG